MTAPFTPPADDSSVQMLRAVFGSIIDHLAGASQAVAQSPQATMLGAAFEYFNSGILFFGSILLTWVTLTGTMHTANDGEALGKNWSTMWTPIRTISATGSLMPVTGGYSLIQAFVLTVVLWSIGLASGMWSKVVDVTVNNNLVQQSAVNVINESSFQDATTAALQMQVCARAVQTAVNAAIAAPDGGDLQAGTVPIAGGTAQGAINLTQISREWDQDGIHYLSYYYEDANWPRSAGICGKLTIESKNATADESRGLMSSTKHFFFFDSSSTVNQIQQSMATQVQSISRQYYSGLFAASSPIDKIAQDIVSSPNTDLAPTELVSAIGLGSQMWTDINAAAVAAAQSNNQNITDALTTGGWIYAGSWQTELGRVQDAIKSTVTHSNVTYTPGQNNLSSSLSGDLLLATQPVLTQAQAATTELVKQAMDMIRKQQGTAAQGTAKSTGVICKTPASPITQNGIDPDEFVTDAGASVKERITTYFDTSIGNSIVSCIIGNLTADDVDPIMQLKGLGDTLMTVSETGLFIARITDSTLDGVEAGFDQLTDGWIARTANFASGGTSNALATGVVTSAVSFLKHAIAAASKFLAMMLYAGYFLSIWVPMVPFMIFALGVIGWLVVVVESVAASSLWMVMHISPEGGDSFVGGQKQGYLLLMSVFFRPALMVLGIIASMSLMIPVMQFLNAGFEIKMRALQANSLIGIGSIIGYLMVYCFLAYSAMMLIFALPQTLPDRILRWISAGIGDLGEQASMARIEGGASAQARAAALKAFGLNDDDNDENNSSPKGQGRQTSRARLVAAAAALD